MRAAACVTSGVETVVARIQKVVERGVLRADPHGASDLRYWLQPTPQKRISCVEELRRQSYGDTPRLQRVAEIIRGFPR